MRGAWRAAALLLIACAARAIPAQAGGAEVVRSARADRVAVTVYRDPRGGTVGAINLRDPGGFALVTETRRVRLPKGRAVLRFEGVAAGIVPVSAIVDGLPGGMVEKNRDARLLSPASLVDGTLGRLVTLTRTDRATGVRSGETATLVAGPVGGVVMKTTRGIETLRCSGLPERVDYAAVPPGLSDQPVLSVTTDTPSARTATVTLSYLTSGFDWRASYVATIAPDGTHLDLFAWLTLANANPGGFVDAGLQAVAGRLNRTAFAAIERQASELRLRCYPLGTTTSNLRPWSLERSEDIVVTGARKMSMEMTSPMAVMSVPAPAPPPPPEDLGDLKLYRVPGRVTLAPAAQKQVALLAAGAVPFERRYRLRLGPGAAFEAIPTAVVLVVRNRKEDRLGIALPAGTTALYADRGGQKLLLGTGSLTDRADGETIRIGAGISRQVTVTQIVEAEGKALLTITNANPFAVLAELPIGIAAQKIVGEGVVLTRVDGVATWTVPVPANASMQLRYRY